MNSDDDAAKKTDAIKEIDEKYEGMNEAVRETAQGITDRIKPLTGEIDLVKPDPPP
jgi:hypothetical protein